MTLQDEGTALPARCRSRLRNAACGYELGGAKRLVARSLWNDGKVIADER